MLWIGDVAVGPRGFSPFVFSVLLLVLAASTVMFFVLVRRWTTHRLWTQLASWSNLQGFKLRRGGETLPPPTDAWAAFHPQVRYELSQDRVQLLEIESDSIPGLPRDRSARWRVLIRKIEQYWPPTALRPVSHPASAIDLFGLSSYPSLAATDRFVVFGSDSSAARILSESMMRALLPPDIGLVVSGSQLLLDFSARAFDPMEFDRMINLAEQLATHLPEAKPVETK